MNTPHPPLPPGNPYAGNPGLVCGICGADLSESGAKTQHYFVDGCPGRKPKPINGDAILASLAAVGWVAWLEEFATLPVGAVPTPERIDALHVMALRRLDVDPCRARHWFFGDRMGFDENKDFCRACGKWVERKGDGA